MTKQSVDDMYGGRHRPFGQVRDGSHRRIESEPPMESAAANRTAHNTNVNQAPEDRHGPGYDNDVSANSWLRSDGTKKPSFDKNNSWRRADGGDDWHSGHDPAVIRSPGKNTPDR